MAEDWFYAKDGQQAGPVSALQLRQLAAAGQLGSSDLVWKQGMPKWVPASEVKGLLGGSVEARSAPAPAVPAAPVPADGAFAFGGAGVAAAGGASPSAADSKEPWCFRAIDRLTH